MTEGFPYRNGVMCADDVSLAAIAAEVPTPFYCYSAARLRYAFHQYSDHFSGANSMVAYAVKACPNLAVIRTLARMGAGADIVSMGEGERALAAGIPAQKIVFSSVGKTIEEMRWALTKDIGQINIESLPEIKQLSEVARALGKTATVTLRINPDIASGAHEKTDTGHGETKFGIDHRQMMEAALLVKSQPNLNLVGIAAHIGSQISTLAPFTATFKFLSEKIAALRAAGFTISRVDVGGGVGITYQKPIEFKMEQYISSCLDHLGNLGCKIVAEPGRHIVGEAGVLVSRVLFVKEGVSKKFLVLDAGMNDLVRPAMYGAWHDIKPVRESVGTKQETYDVVGPVCETSDLFAEDRTLPAVQAGDLVAFMQAGAYGASMSSCYNTRALAAEVIADGTQFAVCRRAFGIEDQLKLESVPAWLQDAPQDLKRSVG